jgi:hypothetical protein
MLIYKNGDMYFRMPDGHIQRIRKGTYITPIQYQANKVYYDNQFLKEAKKARMFATFESICQVITTICVLVWCVLCFINPEAMLIYTIGCIIFIPGMVALCSLGGLLGCGIGLGVGWFFK